MINFKMVNTSFLKTRAKVVTGQNVEHSVVVGLSEAWLPLACWWSGWVGQLWRQLPGWAQCCLLPGRMRPLQVSSQTICKEMLLTPFTE